MAIINGIEKPHLCATCALTFATCDAKNIIFGIDQDLETAGTKDADAVIECQDYMEDIAGVE